MTLIEYAKKQGLLAIQVKAIPKRYWLNGEILTGWNDRDQAYEVVLCAPSLEMWQLEKWKAGMVKAINAYRRQLKAEFAASKTTPTEISNLLKGYPIRGRLACLAANGLFKVAYAEKFDNPLWEIG